MPVESPPVRGALWLENEILSCTIASVTSEHPNFPASSLLNPLRSDTYQSLGLLDTSLVFDRGAVIIPVGLSLIESNLDGGTFIRFRGSDDAAQITNPVYWDFPIYTQDAIGKALKWYLGTPTFGTMGAGRRFWGVRILPATFGSYNTAEDYYEIGVVDIITSYLALRPWKGFKPKPKNPSSRTFSYNHTKWSDPLIPYRQGEVILGGLTPSQWFDIESAIRAHGEKFALLDVHAKDSDPSLKRGGCLYGYFQDTPVDGQVDSIEDNELSFQFEEASG